MGTGVRKPRIECTLRMCEIATYMSILVDFAVELALEMSKKGTIGHLSGKLHCTKTLTSDKGLLQPSLTRLYTARLNSTHLRFSCRDHLLVAMWSNSMLFGGLRAGRRGKRWL